MDGITFLYVQDKDEFGCLPGWYWTSATSEEVKAGRWLSASGNGPFQSEEDADLHASFITGE